MVPSASRTPSLSLHDALPIYPTAVDPTWTWYYDQTHAGTWLATGLVLKAATSGANQPPVSSFTKSCNALDRKSTRLNSSHTVISYAVFCLKKKKVFGREQ